MNRLSIFYRAHKTFFLAVGFLVAFSLTVSYAAPLYNPGDTLDPQCAPGTTNCTVAAGGGGSSQWDTVTGGINFAAGNVGIGTTSPMAALDLEGDGAILAVGIDGSGTAVPDLGPGTRMMWIPSMSAFRAGISQGTEWDSGNVGDASAAFGIETTASGDYSTAFGDSTNAINTIATAFGYKTTASGGVSTAFGNNTTASGSNSTAFGFLTNASGDNSTTFGNTTTASSYNSFAIGQYNVDGGTDPNNWVGADPLFEVGNGTDGADLSDALMILKNGDVGIGNIIPQYLLDLGNAHIDTDGSASFAGGNVTIAADGTLVIANVITLNPDGSAAFGGGSTASGIDSYAFGSGADASVDNSFAFGTGTSASGNGSFSFGAGSQATNDGAQAFGSGSTASGAQSVTFNNNTQALGTGSFAANGGTTASGDYSTTFGIGTTASSYAAFSIGAYNVDGGTAPSSWVGTDPLFEIGNGTDGSDLSDAFIVLKNGKVGIGTATPVTALDLAGNDGAILSTGGGSWTEPNLGSGTRFIWYPQKASFRAGEVNGTQWNNANIGVASAAFGENNTASAEATAVFGTGNTASTSGATAFGSSNTASGSNSFVAGAGNTVSGTYGIAFGENNQATHVASSVFGQGNQAIADNANAFGTSTTASGSASSTFGQSTTASGQASTAFGTSTTASGDYSTAFGTVAHADSYNSFVLGQDNVGGGSATTFVSTDPLFEIGIGTGGNPADALTVLKNGKIGIGNATPGKLLTVGSSAISDGTVVARFQSAGATCDLTVSVTGGLLCTSDMNLKKNINLIAGNAQWTFNNAISFNSQSTLSEILALNPVQYNLKTEQDGTTKHAGFIAQEVQQVFPDLVAADPNTGFLSMNYTGLIPYTVEALKEMNFNITAIDTLTTPNAWRDSLLAWFGDMNNGITSFFSKKVTTNQLCVQDANGETCLTRSQIDQLMQQQANVSGTTTVVGPAPTTPDPVTPAPDATVTESPETDPVTVDPVITPPADAPSGDTQSSDTGQ